MELRLYSFSKKHNSTKQLLNDAIPVATFTDFDLKQNTDIDSPTFLIDDQFRDVNYAYLVDLGRFYFINRYRLGNRYIYEIECELDALATYKSYILASEFFVLYSTSNYNRWLRDDRYPLYIKNSEYIENVSNFIVGQETNLFVANTNETVLLTTVSKEQGLVTWITTEAGIVEIIESLIDAGTNIWESLSLQFGDALGSIVQVMRMPINIDALPTDGQFYQVYLGDYPLTMGTAEPIQMMKLSNSHISAHAHLAIPITYTDFRYTEPYCVARLTLPFVGSFDFSLVEMAPSGGLDIRADIELMTGNIMYTLHDGGTAATAGEIVASYSGQVGCLIPIASTQMANAANIVGSGISIAAGIGLSVAAGNALPAMAGMSQGLLGIVNSFFSSNQKSSTVIGSYSGGRGEFADRACRLCVQKFLTACEPSDIAPIEGRPLCDVVSLATLTGYCRCAGASIDLPANEAVKLKINAFLNEGFYIE